MIGKELMFAAALAFGDRRLQWPAVLAWNLALAASLQLAGRVGR